MEKKSRSFAAIFWKLRASGTINLFQGLSPTREAAR
jgi:hypothetical protein